MNTYYAFPINELMMFPNRLKWPFRRVSFTKHPPFFIYRGATGYHKWCVVRLASRLIAHLSSATSYLSVPQVTHLPTFLLPLTIHYWMENHPLRSQASWSPISSGLRNWRIWLRTSRWNYDRQRPKYILYGRSWRSINATFVAPIRVKEHPCDSYIGYGSIRRR